MNIIKYLILLFTTMAMLRASQEITIRNIETKTINSSYGKIYGDNIVYIGINSSLASMEIWFKKLNTNIEFKVNAIPFSIPIGWIDNETMVLFEKENNDKNIKELNIKTGVKRQIVNVNSVVSPEREICIDNKIIAFIGQSIQGNENGIYKYNIEDNSLKSVKKIQEENIIRIAYCYEKDLIAYIRIGKEGTKYLEVFDGKNTILINKYTSGNYAEEIPVEFTDDGTGLYYVENDITTVIRRYNFSTKSIEHVFEFPKGVKCIDLSYSQKRLLFTIEVENGNLVTYEDNDVNLSHEYNYKFEFENGRKLFYIEF